MIEEFIATIFKNRKRYSRCAIGFIVSLLIVNYGVPKTIFVLMMALLGYISGVQHYSSILTKYRKNFFDNIRKK